MNRTDPKSTRVRSLSKPIWKNNTTPINETSMQDVPSLFAYQNELEKTRDEIYHIKKDLNKKYLEITQTKADITKYEESLKKNYKIIEEISLTINKSSSITISQLLYNPKATNLPTDLNLNPMHIAKLRELLAVNILKTKSKELTKKISNQNCEIDLLKNDSKANSITKLENTFLINVTELKDLKNNYDSLQMKYKDMYTQAEQIIEERDQLKLDVTKHKTEYLMSRARVMKLKENKNTCSSRRCLNDSLSSSNRIDNKINSPKRESSVSNVNNSNSNYLSNENTKQFSKEVSENSIFKKQSENGKILIQAYNIEKEKLDKKIDSLCNSNQEAEELNESKTVLLKKKNEEYNELQARLKAIQSDLDEKNKAMIHENDLKRMIEKLKKEKAQWNDKVKSLEDKKKGNNEEKIEDKIAKAEKELNKERKRNTELQELIDNERNKGDSMEIKVDNKKEMIDQLKKEINDLKRAQEEAKKNEAMMISQPEPDTFFSTGVNIKAKSKYEQDNKEKEQPHNPIQEPEEEEYEEPKDTNREYDIDQITEEVIVSLSEEKLPQAYVPFNQKVIKQSPQEEDNIESRKKEKSIQESKDNYNEPQNPAEEIDDNVIDNAYNRNKVDNKSVNKSINNKSVNKSINNKSENKSINNKSENKSINNKSVNKSINNKSENKSINNKSENKSINNKSENKSINNKSENKKINNKSENNNKDELNNNNNMNVENDDFKDLSIANIGDDVIDEEVF